MLHPVSISIIYQDELWGLIACHNYTPRFINIAQRETAKLVELVLSSAIGFRSNDQEQKLTAQHSRAIKSITRNMLRNLPVHENLNNEDEHSLTHVLNCSGTALHFENEFSPIGQTPPKEFMVRLVNWLDKQSYEDSYYMSKQLSADFPEAASYKYSISGILACRLGKDLNE